MQRISATNVAAVALLAALATASPALGDTATPAADAISDSEQATRRYLIGVTGMT